MDETFERLNKEFLIPRAEEFAKIIAAGDEVAIAVFEPSQRATIAMRTMGSKGKTIFCLSDHWRQQLAELWEKQFSDKARANWLKNKRATQGRILVFWGDGSLCVNFTPRQGFWIEPGTWARNLV